MRLLSTLALAMLLGLVANVANAQEGQTATLALDIPGDLSTCPSERVIRRTVAAHLGWDPFREEADLHIVASLARDADGLVARVQAFDADGASIGERELHSASNDCAELARAMSLAISVAVDPFILTRAGSDAPELSAEPEPDPATDPEASPIAPADRGEPPEPTSSADRAETSGTTWVGGAIGVSSGVIPSFRPFFTGFIERRIHRVSVSASLRYTAPSKADGPSGGQVVAQALGVGVAACFAPRGFGACGVADLDLLLAHGQGVADRRSSTRLVPRVGVRVSADFDGGLPHLLIRPFAELRFALSRPELQVNHEAAYTVPVVGFSAGLMLAWQGP